MAIWNLQSRKKGGEEEYEKIKWKIKTECSAYRQ